MTKYTVTITEDERTEIQRALHCRLLDNASPGTSPEADRTFDLYSKFKDLKTRMGIVDKEKVDYYIAWGNTDRTEGRGRQVARAISLCESTARRIGRGQDVQGSDCRVVKESAVRINDKFYCPLSWAQALIIAPTKEDLVAERVLAEQREREEKRKQVLEHARTLGLSDDDIALLASKD